jgi:hypothetical protein
MIARIVERGAETAKLGFHPHATARHEPRAGKRGHGHPADSGLPRSRLDRQHGALHEVGTWSPGSGTSAIGGSPSLPHQAIIPAMALEDTVVETRDVRVTRLMAEVEQER